MLHVSEESTAGLFVPVVGVILVNRLITAALLHAHRGGSPEATARLLVGLALERPDSLDRALARLRRHDDGRSLVILQATDALRLARSLLSATSSASRPSPGQWTAEFRVG